MESAGDSGSQRGVLPRRAPRPQTRAGGVRCVAGAARASGPFRPRPTPCTQSPRLACISGSVFSFLEAGGPKYYLRPLNSQMDACPGHASGGPSQRPPRSPAGWTRGRQAGAGHVQPRITQLCG